MNRVWGNITKTAIALAVCAAAPIVCADTVQLVNGDTLTGKVVAQDEKSVTLEHAVLGKVVVQRDRIAKVDTTPAKPAKPEAKPKAKSKDGKDADAGTIKKKAKEAANNTPPQTLQAYLDLWDSKATIGLNGTAGNTDRQNYLAKFSTEYQDGCDRWLINAQWYYARANSSTTQNQFDTNITRDWLQTDSDWFFFMKGQYRYDAMRTWQNRASGFGGGGYTLAKTDDVEVNTRLGFGGTYEFGDINQFTPEAMFGGSVLKWNITDKASLKGEMTYFPALDDTSGFRVESKLEYSYKLDLTKGMSLKLGIQNEYDSQTPNDNGHSDLRYYAALGFDF